MTTKRFQWMLAAILFCGLITMFSACTDVIDNSASQNQDADDKYEEGVELMVDPSSNWRQDKHPVYFSEISSLPLEFRQALSMTFPNVVSNLFDAEMAIMDIKDVLLHFDELDAFYKGGGLMIIIPTGSEEVLDGFKVGDVVGWDELLWATHNSLNDDFFLLDEPDEIVTLDEEGHEVTRKIEKDLNYYNLRLVPLVDWMAWYEDEVVNKYFEEYNPSEARSLKKVITRGESDEMPDFDKLTVSLEDDFRHYTVNFPFSLNKQIDKATLSAPDVLNCHGSISIHFDVLPLYMGSVNGDKAGDYYAVRSSVIPHNSSMWAPFVGKHGWTRNRVYGYWFKDMDYKFVLVDPETSQPAQGLQFVKLPFPENSTSSRNNSNEFTFGLNGSITGGYEGGPKAEASVGFSCEWREAVSYDLKNIDYDRNTSTNNTVEYYWYSNNVVLDDDMDNYGKYFPDDVHKEFEAKSVWLWRVPYGKAGVEDESNKSFYLTAYVHPRYSSWYHWRGTATFNSNRADYDVDFSSSYTSEDHIIKPEFTKHGWVSCSFKIPAPDRGKWGLISLKNASNNYTMRNVRIYKKGEEDKDPVVRISNTFAPKESAETAVKEGTYTVTFEFINPDNNKLASKGTITDVEVEMGKNKKDATNSISTGDAELVEQ